MPKDLTDNPAIGSEAKAIPRAILTLADAIAAVGTWTDLPVERQRTIVSSLNLIARSAGLPPAAAKLTVPFVQQHLVDRTPAALGISKATRDNAISNARLVLGRLDLIDPEPETLAPAWQLLLARFDSREEPSRARAPYIRFAKFATLRGIDPAAVDDDVFTDFTAWVVTRVLVARPERVAGTFRRTWNDAVMREPGWPQGPLALPPRSSDYVVPREKFPASFQADVQTFLTNRGTNDRAAVFDGDAPPPASAMITAGGGNRSARPYGPWKESSIKTRRDHINWAASGLVATGVPITEVTSLGALFEPADRPWKILRYFYQRAGNKPSITGDKVGEVLAMIAWLHLRLPETRIAQIKQWHAPLKVIYKGMTEKNDRTIRALLEPSRYETLMRLPIVAMDAAEKRLVGEPRFATSLGMRALAIQFLLNLPPLRLANLIGLRLDYHLQRNDPRGKFVTHVWVPEDETKNARMISAPIGTTLAVMIETWIKKFRPGLAAPGNLYLFPGLDRDSISPQGMRQAVVEITHEFVGVKVTPHQFRHLNAVSFLKEHPGQYEMVRQMLNHATVTTSVKAYCGVEQDDAHDIFDNFNEERQQAATAPSKRPAPARKVPPGRRVR